MPRQHRKRGEYGPEREFVRAHLLESNSEIARKAAAAGLDISAKNASRYKYRIAREVSDRVVRPALELMHRVPPMQAPGVAGKPNARVYSKEAQLRQLIFELGYDAVAVCLEEYKRWVREPSDGE